MAQVLVNIRMEEDLKKEMEKTCHELGINMTTAFTIFARKMTREQRIPFEVSVDPFYSPENIQAIHDSIEEYNSGQTISKTMAELETMADE